MKQEVKNKFYFLPDSLKVSFELTQLKTFVKIHSDIFFISGAITTDSCSLFTEQNTDGGAGDLQEAL